MIKINSYFRLNIDLHTLKISGIKLHSDFLQMLSKRSETKPIRLLDLSYSNMDLTNSDLRLNGIISISISGNKINSEAFISLLGNSTLKRINASYCEISKDEIKMVLEYLNENAKEGQFDKIDLTNIVKLENDMWEIYEKLQKRNIQLNI